MLIVFEGGEGVGKSTQVDLLEKALLEKNLPAIKTREPGGTPFAEKIRALFKEKTEDAPTSLTELYLICAARAQHMQKVIEPNLMQNKIILCDRFLDSTYVYQHILGGLEKNAIDIPSNLILKGLLPNLTFIFNCKSNVSIDRIKSNREEKDRIDSYSKDIHAVILDAYNKVFYNNIPYPCGKIPQRVLIDASRSIDEIFSQIKLFVKKYLSIEL